MSTQTVLFDNPGPRAKLLYRVVGVVGVIILLGIAAVIVVALGNPDNNQWAPQKWLPLLEPVTWTAYLLPGLWSTLSAAVCAIVLAAVLGLLLGMGRLSSVTVVRGVCGVLVEFLRAVPVLVMMLFAYYFAIFGLHIFGRPATFFGVVAGLTLYNGAVIAELIRSGVHSLPKGQREAALAVGMTHTQTLVTVLLPQAVTAMLPSLISQLVVVLKDTALGYMISYSELLRAAQTFATPNANLIPTLMVTAVMFIIINFSLSMVANKLEARLRRSRRGPRVVVTADVIDDPAEAPTK
ncbi:MAG TPA: amino acid ABC transporter permease [Candidatus Avipropionibacterium avicola]|uniref:Amino acid ABC transporter permease n=1 Tax=Candidatus Avipropionibacterium avicola TaxID=2840701 RepID=A0A9D1GX31_9ACTN|nr:amino acid ABC transporter permease [Candidatus Avipropionibacterium avicola]